MCGEASKSPVILKHIVNCYSHTFWLENIGTIPTSQAVLWSLYFIFWLFSLPPTFLICRNLLWIFLLTEVLVHKWVQTYAICLSVPGLGHSTRCLPVPIILSRMTIFYASCGKIFHHLCYLSHIIFLPFIHQKTSPFISYLDCCEQHCNKRKWTIISLT